MKKRITLGLVSAAALLALLPSVASAALTEAQIQAILGLLQSFGADTAIVSNVNSSLRGLPTTGSGISSGTPAYCPNFTYNLYLGLNDSETGGQISQLQKFLAQDSLVFPEGLITGFYGPLTEQAVQRWQAKQGVVSSGSPDTTGYGVIGPQTREKMRASCDFLPTPTPVPPTSSNLPPVISGIFGPTALKSGESGTWTVTAKDPENGPLSYTVLWGDEIESVGPVIRAPSAYEQVKQTATFSHTYYGAGVFTPVFYVTDTQGLSAKTSISVNVGSVISKRPNYYAEPTGSLIRGQSYDFVGKVTNALPNAKVYFFLQRPDGTLKYSDRLDQDILQKAPSHFTDANGNYSVSARQTLTIEGQNGTWASWVTVGGIASNKLFHTVTGSAISQPPITVLAPNGGESWTVGSAQTISWNSSNAPSGAWVALYLEPTGEFIVQGLPVSGKYSWTISDSYCQGDVCGSPRPTGSNFKISAKLYTGDYLCIGFCPQIARNTVLLASDTSDAPFSIVSSDTAALSFSVATDKSTYTPDEQIQIVITAKNNSSATKVLNFSTACQAGYAIAFYDSSKNQICAQMLTSVSIAPYGLQTWRITHNPTTYRIPAGSYKLTGKVFGYGEATTPITIQDAATPSITVLSPNGGEQFVIGQTYDIKWSASSGYFVGIFAIPASGGAGVTVSNGYAQISSPFRWTVPTTLTPGNYKIQIQLAKTDSEGRLIFVAEDYSDAPFSITSQTQPSVKITYPVANSTLTSKNTSVSGTCSNYSGTVDVFYYSDKKEETFVECISGKWSANIFINSNAGSGSFDLYAQLYPNNTSIEDKIKLYFNWSSTPSITVLSPNGGESWQMGQSYEIRWTSQNISWPYITVALLKGGSVVGQPLFTHLTNDGVERWAVPSDLVAGSDYKISIYCTPISGVSGCEPKDDSDAAFSIVAAGTAKPFIDSLVPNLGSAGTSVTVYGSGFNNLSAVLIGDNVTMVSPSYVSPDGTKLVFTFPADALSKFPAYNYSVRVSNVGNVSVASGLASNYLLFQIVSTQLSITVLSPNGGESWASGSQQVIKWQGGSQTSSIAIKLVSKSPTYGCGTADSFLVKEIAYGTANDGNESWVVPQDLKSGIYCMRVSAINEGLSDDSDSAFSIVSSGTLTVSLDASTPIGKTVLPGSTNVPLTILKLSASAEAINLRQLALQADGSNVNVLVSRMVSIWDGATKVGECVFAISNTCTSSFMSITIPANSSKSLTIKGDFSPVGPTYPAVPGDTIAINYDGDRAKSTYGVGLTSGNTIYSGSISDTGAYKFTLGSSVTTPSITVISPNGGESWQVGSTQTIRWSALNMPSGARVHIDLKAVSSDGSLSGAGYTVGADILAADGQFQWSVPKVMSPPGMTLVPPPGKYKILILCSSQNPPGAQGGDCSDLSDSSFGIVAATKEVTSLSANMLSHSGLAAFNPTAVVDRIADNLAWHTDTSLAGAWMKIDLGIGYANPFISARIYNVSVTSGRAVGNYTVQYSDDDIIWRDAVTNFVPSLSGWNVKMWSNVGAHRYWRLLLTDTPGFGPWLGELELLTYTPPISQLETSSTQSAQLANVLEAVKPLWWPAGF